MLKKLRRWFAGHISIGHLTLYGNNAMHFGVTYYTKKYGYICFRLPFRSCGRWWPLYLFCSPNATPWASTFMLGHGKDNNWALSRIRRRVFGHNFNLNAFISPYGCRNYDLLSEINQRTGFYKSSYAKGARIRYQNQEEVLNAQY